jgi:hypothetical protein
MKKATGKVKRERINKTIYHGYMEEDENLKAVKERSQRELEEIQKIGQDQEGDNA